MTQRGAVVSEDQAGGQTAQGHDPGYGQPDETEWFPSPVNAQTSTPKTTLPDRLIQSD